MATRSEILGVINSYSGPALITSRFRAPHQQWSDGTETSRSYQYNLTQTFNAVGLQMLWPNWAMGLGGSPGELAGLNDIIVRASVSNGAPGAVAKAVTWNGVPWVRILPGATLVNDRLPLSVFTQYGSTLKTSVSVDAMGQKWPRGSQSNFSKAGELTMSGTIDGAGVQGYMPLSMWGTPIGPRTKKAVVVLSDSLSLFDGSNLDRGYIRLWLDGAGVACHMLSCTSQTATNIMNVNTSYALTHLLNSPAEIIFCTLGGNDILQQMIAGTITNADQVMALLQSLWTMLGNIGKELLVSTITPCTAPQVTQAMRDVVNEVNNRIRLIPPSVARVIDVAAAAESSPGVPKPGYLQGDGIHFESAGAVGVANALNANPTYANYFLI